MPGFANVLKRRSLHLRQSDRVQIKGSKSDSQGSGSHRVQRNAHSQLFRPGDCVLESGIYEVVHDSHHRSAHEVVMITNDHFPVCDTCTDQVRFRLIRTAPYIFSDEDFEAEQ